MIKYLIFFLGVAGCQFHPLHDARVFNPQPFQIVVKGVDPYIVFNLQKELDTHIKTITQKYHDSVKLTVKLDEKFGDIALNKNIKVLRSQGQFHAHVLVSHASVNLLDIDVSTMTSYTVPDMEEFTIISAESSAKDRLIKDLAQRICTELRIVFSDYHKS